MTLAACTKSSTAEPTESNTPAVSSAPTQATASESGPTFGSLAPKIDVTKDGKGVTDTQIKIVFNLALEPCGDDPNTKSTYVVKQVYKDDLNLFVKWFNEHGNFPKGRQLVAEFVNDGGPNAGCADTARQAALKAANEIGAFAALGSSTNNDGNAVFAQTVTENGTVDIAPNGMQVAKDLADRWPYAWSLYQIGQASLEELTWFIDKRVKGTEYTADDGTKSPRKWGVLFLDNDLQHTLADGVLKNLKDIGIDAKAYYVAADTAQAGQQAAALTAQIKSDGVNSMVFGAAGTLSAVTLLGTFNTQKLFPDWYISDYGAATGLALFNNALYPTQVKRFYGVSTPSVTALRIDIDKGAKPGKSADIQENDTNDAATAAYYDAGGTSKTPGVGVPLGDFWIQLSTLALGIQNAGDTLNAYTFSEGLTSTTSCQISRYFGKDVDQVPLVKFSEEQPWAYHGFTTIYWTTKESFYGQDSGSSTGGFFESYDGYKRFITKDDLPAQPTYDTGVKGDYPYTPATDTGLSPTSTCPAS